MRRGGILTLTAPIVAISMMGALIAYRDGQSLGWALWLLTGLFGAVVVPLVYARVIATRPIGPAIRTSTTPHATEPHAGSHADSEAQRALQASVTRTEERARQMEAEKSAFLARVNHELRTPLNGVIGVIELLRNRQFEGAERERYLDTAYLSCRHIMRIINDNLDLARMDEGQLALRRESFDVRDCFDAIEQMMAISMREKAQQFSSHIGDDVPLQVIGDRDRLMQVLVNLAENAHKYTAAGGTVSLRVTAEPDVEPDRRARDSAGCGHGIAILRFAVEDDGIGIDRGSHENIFEAYSQALEAGANIREGSGLGLAICARLVALMGGEIGVESELGEGSLFWFTIRLEVAHVELSAAPAYALGSAVESASGSCASEPASVEATAERTQVDALAAFAEGALLAPQGLRVLLVDDNRLNRKVAERLLALDCHRVTSTENGEMALEAMGREQFDVVLMDIHMPIMDGHEATRRIRADERGTDEHMPIIAITASSLSEEVERVFASGMDDIVSKPVTLESLRAALAHIEHVQ